MTEVGDLGSLAEAKPFLNIKLGEAVMNNLAGSLSEVTGKTEAEMKELLGKGVDFVEKMMQKAGTNHEVTNYAWMDRLKNMGSLTGEEKALAAESIVMGILAGDKVIYDPDTNLYKTHSANTLRALDKADLAFVQATANQFTLKETLSVGTSFERMGMIEIFARAVADGPSDENPQYQTSVRREERVQPDGEIKVFQQEFSGGGKSPQQWQAERGYPIRTHDLPSVRIQNYIDDSKSLRAEWDGSIGELKRSLTRRP